MADARHRRDAPSDARDEPRFYVGLGASPDGGFESLEDFVRLLPERSDLCFFVAYRHDPTRPGSLIERLAERAALPVLAAPDGATAEPDHIYVLTPETRLTLLRDGTLRVSAAQEADAPLDALFRALACAQDARAIGVLLSGASDDGRSGLQAIRESGGLALARADAPTDRATAGTDAPSTLSDTEALARKVLEYAASVDSHATRDAALDQALAERLKDICSLVRAHTSHDFASYKDGTLVRRIRRRMNVRQLSLDEYVALLARDSAEAEALVCELLIGVTRFFRDPEAFQALAQKAIPRVTQTDAPDSPIRIWVAGCASGEEAYSVAILAREHLERLASKRPLQIFATDLDGEHLARARAGLYPVSIADDVGAARLARFFARESRGYQANKELRESCIFSEHSLIRDPPFSHIDIVCCRNVLIYFDAELQARLIPLFHYALRPGGFLLLGPSEGVGAVPDLFEVVDPKNRLFRRREPVVRPPVDFPLSPRSVARAPGGSVTLAPSAQVVHASLQEKAMAAFERMALVEYTAPSAVVSAKGDVVLVAGRLARYFQLPAGELTTNLLDAVPPSLRVELRVALHSAVSSRRKVVRDNILVDLDEERRRIRLIVRPLPGLGPETGLFAVIFQEFYQAEAADDAPPSADKPELPLVDQLERELRSTRAELRRSIEDIESANEELKSANEELISTNEELQSTNEELQTSKEELQSLNEELETVNTELRQKVDDLAAVNSDLHNLFASTQVATIFLDRSLRVTRFTPAATELFHLMDVDVGRPITDLAPRFDAKGVVGDATEVLQSLEPIERQVRSAEGRWFIFRVLPYRTVENLVAGVVVTFVDVSQLKRVEEALRESEQKYSSLFEHAPFAVALIERETEQLVTVNEAFGRMFGVARGEVLGKTTEELGLVHDRAARERMYQEMKTSGTVREFELAFRTRSGEPRVGVFTFEPLELAGRSYALQTSIDITERKRAEQALRDSERRYRRLFDTMSQGKVVHELVYDETGEPCDARLLLVNPAFERLLKVQAKDVIGKTVGQCFGPIDDAMLRRFANAALHGKAEQFELRMGARGPWFSVSAYQVEPGKFAALFADITERKHAEQALRDREEWLRLALDAAEQGSWQVELETGRVAASPRMLEIFGLTEGPEVSHLAEWNLAIEEDRELVDRTLEEAYRSTDGRYRVEYRIRRRSDGEIRWVQTAGRIQRDTSGRPVRRVGVARDVTVVRLAAEELGASEQRLRLTLDAARAGTFEWDSRTNETVWSESLCRLYDLDPASYKPSLDAWLGAIHPEDRPRVAADMEAARSSGRELWSEWRVTRRNGDVHWFMTRAQPIRDTSGAPPRYLGIVLDITERKRAEEALRASEEKFGKAFHLSSSGMCITRLHDGSFIEINERFQEETRIRWKDLEAKPGLTLWKDPEDRREFVRDLLEAGVVRNRECALQRPDGSTFTGLLSSQLAELEGERVILSAITDITERKRSSEALERSREGLRRLAVASLAIIAQSDLEKMLQAVAEAALQLTGARLASCGHGLVGGRLMISRFARAPGVPECPQGDLFEVEHGGVEMSLLEGAESIRLTQGELEAHPRSSGSPDGHVPMRGLLGVRMVDRDARPSGMILVSDRSESDFSEEDESLLRQLATVASLALQHVEARLSLEEADRHRSEFLAMLSHELRNPLAPIRNSIYILQRAMPGGEAARRAEGVIDRQVMHLTRIVDDLLDVTRISRGKVKLQRQDIDFGEIVRRTVEDHRAAFADARIAIEVDVPDSPVKMNADPTRLTQVIGNLLHNASKFTPKGGRVEVSLETDLATGQAALRVRDTGLGIASDMLPRLFEPFTQADVTLDRSQGGLGLGLALVKSLVEMHGGTATVQSKGLEMGSEFTIRLPLERTSASEGREVGHREPVVGARRVLIIDDNVDAAESLREVLDLCGHTTEVAFSGAEGIESARAFRPDIVLCDIGLPGMDGYEVARAMQTDPQLKAIKLVAVTGYAAPEDIARAQRAGFHGHIAKPPAISQIEAVLGGVASGG